MLNAALGIALFGLLAAAVLGGMSLLQLGAVPAMRRNARRIAVASAAVVGLYVAVLVLDAVVS